MTVSLAAVLLLLPGLGGAWTLTMADTVRVAAGEARLADFSSTPVPAAVADILVVSGGRPGTGSTVSRGTLLRHLVRAELARDVRFAGAENCRVVFAGDRIDTFEMADRLRADLAELLPQAPPGAPATWCGLDGDLPRLTVAEDWRLEIIEPRRLEPGRNLVRVRINDGDRAFRFTATVICHLFGEVARARTKLERGELLGVDAFTWEWTDLATVDRSLVVGREALAGMSAAAALAAGDPLRTAAICRTPLVVRGDPVELILSRGGVAVSVAAHARQNGHRDQMITVRNDLNGKLVSGRVVGPGRVAWKR